MARGLELIKDPKARKVLTKWLAGEERIIVTLELSYRTGHGKDDVDLDLLDIALEEGLRTTPWLDGVEFIAMSKAVKLDLEDWTV